RGEGTGGQRSLAAARDRAQLGRVLADDEPVALAAQVDAVVAPTAARVGRRLQLADQAHLLERRLELGSGDVPLDPVERRQRRLDRRALAFAAEVGAKARAQIAGAADVEHLSVAVAKQIDPRARRSAVCKRTLAVDAALAGSAKRTQVGEMPRPELLREPDQVYEH